MSANFSSRDCRKNDGEYRAGRKSKRTEPGGLLPSLHDRDYISYSTSSPFLFSRGFLYDVLAQYSNKKRQNLSSLTAGHIPRYHGRGQGLGPEVNDFAQHSRVHEDSHGLDVSIYWIVRSSVHPLFPRLTEIIYCLSKWLSYISHWLKAALWVQKEWSENENTWRDT